MVSSEQPAPQPGAIAASRAVPGARRGSSPSSLAKRRRDAGMAQLSVQVAAEGSEGDIGETDHLSPIFTSPPPVEI